MIHARLDPVHAATAGVRSRAHTGAGEAGALRATPAWRATPPRADQAEALPTPAPARPAGRARSGLAPWQERRAKELLADIAAALPLAEVARACGLSRSHFSMAFKQSTGASPHAWFTYRRVAAAQALLRDTDRPLAEVALACGFGDQSHLSRVFNRFVGTSPGQWRRQRAVQALKACR